jgi:tryptophan synthase alpha subunit
VASAELTIELPAEEADFLRAYAREHGITVSILMARYAQA